VVFIIIIIIIGGEENRKWEKLFNRVISRRRSSKRCQIRGSAFSVQGDGSNNDACNSESRKRAYTAAFASDALAVVLCNVRIQI
jgi:hypothetical protein